MSPRSGGFAVCCALAAGLLLAGCGRSLSWAPDSRSLAIDVDGRLQLFDPASGRLTPLETGGEYAVNPSFSPDGRRVAYYRVRDGGADGRICDVWMRRVGAPSGSDVELTTAVLTARSEPVSVLAQKMRAAAPLVWSPNGKELAYSRVSDGDRGAIEVLRVDSRKIHRLGRSNESQLMPAWSPSGQELAYVAQRQSSEKDAAFNLYVARPDAGTRARRLVEGRIWPYWPMTWAADGQAVVVMTQPEGTRSFALWLASAESESSRLLTRVDTPQASITPDLKAVVYMGGRDNASVIYSRAPFDRDQVLDRIGVATSAESGATEPSPLLLYPMVSPDGKTVALPLTSGRRELRLYEVTTGRRSIHPLP